MLSCYFLQDTPSQYMGGRAPPSLYIKPGCAQVRKATDFAALYRCGMYTIQQHG